MDLDMLEWRRMNAIAKTSTIVLVLVASLPLLTVTVSGCDKFKKGGDADAAAEGGPATPAETTTATDTATPSATTITTPTWHPPARVDGGAKVADAGPPVKLADGGTAAPIPTPVPNGTLVPPPGFPTTLPTTIQIPTALPSTLTIPTVIPTAPKASH